MADVRVQVDAERAVRVMRKMGRAGPPAMARSLFGQAQLIMRESKKITPVMTGALRSTGKIEDPEVTDDGAVVTMGYGGPAAPYALVVHEDTEAFHRHPTQSKYLEQPVMEAAPRLGKELAHDMREELREHRDTG